MVSTVTPHSLPTFEWLLVALCCIGALYMVVAVLASLRALVDSQAGSTMPRPRRGRPVAGVSVLKPLCGAEPHLFDNLATFCVQTHSRFQLVFGVSSPDDPAIAVVRRLKLAFADRDITLVVDSRVHGSNLKVSNLMNIAQRARYDLIVVADSDIAVPPDYLTRVVEPLADPQVGVVTCLYSARGVGGFWPRVGALFINEWFAPSVRVAHATGSRRFGFGATLALRRTALERIGGFDALKNCLADDYWLAELTRGLGLRTVLSPVMVTTDVIESDFTALWQREVRWLRTIRSVSPAGFAFLFVTFTTPWVLVGAALMLSLHPGCCEAHPIAADVLTTGTLAGAVARLMLHAQSASRGRNFWRDLPLVPLRDTLLLLQWWASVLGSYVVWRGTRVPVGAPAVAGAAEAGSLNIDAIEAIEAMETTDGA
jgi:ceramide glucosyltransferase